MASGVTWRVKRIDARKVGRTFGANELNIHSRPQRLAAGRKRTERDWDVPFESEEDDEASTGGDEAADADFLPAPEFSPDLRYSAGGTFSLSRSITVHTTTRSTPWTPVGASTGGGRNTNAQFGGESADVHGRRLEPRHQGQPTATGKAFEWCHMIADSLGGPTSQANLFCGTFHANTAMLCIESVLRGRTDFEVQVEVEQRAGTVLGERITYRIRRARKGGEPKRVRSTFEQVIDGLATGCTKLDGEALSGEVRKWLREHG